MQRLTTDELDISQLELSDIIDFKALQSLVEDFYTLAHIPMGINDLQGKVLMSVGWQDICTQFHRVHPETCRNCVENDTRLSADVSPGEYKLYKCKNNMWDAVTPLMMGDHHVGNLFAGQFFFADEPLDYELFRAQARKYGFNEKEYLAAVEAVPRLSRGAVNTGMECLRKIAKMLSQMSYSNIQLTRSLAEHKRSQEALDATEKLVRRLVDAQMIGVCLWNESGRIEYANETFLAMLGYTREEFEQLSLCYKDITPPEYHPACDNALEHLLITGSCPFFELVHVRKDGTTFPVLVSLAWMDEPGKGVAWLLDISRQKALEAQLLQTHKMEAVGQLAGGIAHDFNNLLMIIGAHAELLSMGNLHPEAQAKYIRRIESATKQATQLTRKLLAFSRKQELAVTEVEVCQLVREAIELISPSLPKEVELTFRCGAECWVRADRSQLEQVVVNLVLNARDAMPRGGRIVVDASDILVSGGEVGLHDALPAGEYALLKIADTGDGIPPENIHRIFEPFFTTKEKDRGTGLGLSLVYATVTQSGGHIEVKSSMNTGTTFFVYLPVINHASVEEGLKKELCSRQGCPLAETILVVDDEEAIRNSIRALLEGCGLVVEEASDATEALQTAEELKDSLAVLVTDVVMPGMLGTELANALRKKHSELPVVFMSGYAAGEQGLELFDRAAFVQKPFSRAMLIKALQRAGRCPNTGKACVIG